MNLFEKDIWLKHRSEEVLLRPLYDIHYGSANCDERQLKADIQWIKARKNCYTFLGGDMIEAINFTDKRFEQENIKEDMQRKLFRLVQTQVEEICNILEPIKDRIMFVLEGNHEEKCKKVYGYDSAYAIAHRLKIPNCSYSTFARISFRRGENFKSRKRGVSKVLVIYATHGFGAGRKIGAKVNNIVSLVEGMEADIYIMGHNHGLQAVSQPRLEISRAGELRFKARKKLYCLGGTYLKTYQVGASNYAERKGYLPTEIGSICIKIKPWNKIHEGHYKNIDLPIQYMAENIGEGTYIDGGVK